MNMKEFLNLINNNIYIIMFLTTIFDHSGIAVGILSAGIFISIGNANFMISLAILSMSLIISDLIFMLFGRYLADKYSIRKNYFSKIYKFNIKLLSKGSNILNQEQLNFYIFGKFVPYVGKFVPLFMGYQYYSNIINITKLIIGNTIYIITFLLLGMFFGNIVIKYSFTISIILLILFCIIYKFGIESKKRTEIKGNISK